MSVCLFVCLFVGLFVCLYICLLLACLLVCFLALFASLHTCLFVFLLVLEFPWLVWGRERAEGREGKHIWGSGGGNCSRLFYIGLHFSEGSILGVGLNKNQQENRSWWFSYFDTYPKRYKPDSVIGVGLGGRDCGTCKRCLSQHWSQQEHTGKQVHWG